MRRTGFSMIEVITYITLVSISLVLLTSFEVTTHNAVLDQRRAFEVATQADTLYQHLREDIRVAETITTRDGGAALIIQRFDGAEVQYVAEAASSAKDETVLTRVVEGSDAGSRIWPRIASQSFEVRSDVITADIQVLRARTETGPAFLPFRWTFRTLKTR